MIFEFHGFIFLVLFERSAACSKNTISMKMEEIIFVKTEAVIKYCLYNWQLSIRINEKIGHAHFGIKSPINSLAFVCKSIRATKQNNFISRRI